MRVVARCRPLTAQEKSNGATRIVKVNENKVILHNPLPTAVTKESTFQFDNCFFLESKNVELYKDVAEPMLRKALEGQNVTFVSFGQTHSGRSHTIMGDLEEAGLITMFCQALFSVINDASTIKKFFVTASFLEVSDEYVHDLINPSGLDLTVRQHPQLGLYVDDLAEVVVSSSEDLIRFCDQGNRIRKLSKNDLTEKERSSAIFSIILEQRSSKDANLKGLRSTINFAVLEGSENTSKAEDASFTSASLNNLQQMVSAMADGPKDVSTIARESRLTRILQDSFGGNSNTTLIVHVSPADADFTETYSALKFATAVKNVKNSPKKNENDSGVVIKQLREEISRLRDRLASADTSTVDTEKNDDVQRMEELIKDLQIAKMQTWEEKEEVSEMFLEERRHHLANKGILDWVMDPRKKETREIQEKLTNLQKEKEQLMIEYKEKRKIVDDLKESLQAMITDFSKLTEQGKQSEEEGKKKVAEIHELKEKLKNENDALKKLKQTLKDVQEKQKSEKEDAKTQASTLQGNMEMRYKLEAEKRDKLEKENHAALQEFIDSMNFQTEQEKSEVKLKKGSNSTCTIDDLIRVELESIDFKGKNEAMAYKLEKIGVEKKQLKKDIEDLYKRTKEEMEIQQLQHFQTFRQYREVFEERRSALEQRYRTLLEDSIQDAVYLSSRNQELQEENDSLRQEMAELRDKVSMLSGRPESPYV